MTALNILRRSTPVTRVKPKLLVSAAGPLRPVLIAIVVFAAAFASPTLAHADPGDDATNPAPSSVGDAGGAGDAAAQAGQSICPMLVQPGSDIAGSATQLSGNGGFAPLIAGFVAGAAIQAQCPAFVSSVASGNLPIPVPGMPSGAAPDNGGAAPPN